jgi:hypothetical protein
MQLHARLLLLNVILVALLSGWCGNGGSNQNGQSPSPTPSPFKSTATKRLSAGSGEEVAFYPTFGYKDANGWNLSLRGWVHEDGRGVERVVDHIQVCGQEHMAILKVRTADLLDESKNNEKVIIKFDSDPENKSYELKKSKADGIVTIDLLLTDAQAKQLLEKQGSPNGWLTYRAISGDHTGLGRVKLIEPGPGESLVSDIDDTIKITQVPEEKKVVLKNTFCLPFQPVGTDMAKNYKDRGDIPVHYVSGGPEQLFGPLYDYLIIGEGGFPEGTFHLKFYPTPGTLEGLRTIIDAVKSSMSVTYAHKVGTIKWLMEKFPDRQFTLVGDSGEVDPEVYGEIKKWRPAQVKEIIIRDVINDSVVNNFRLAGMTIIKVDQPACVEDKHFDDLKKRVEEAFPGQTYNPNTAPPCPPAKSK